MQPIGDEHGHREQHHRLHEPAALAAGEEIAGQERIEDDGGDADAYFSRETGEPERRQP